MEKTNGNNMNGGGEEDECIPRGGPIYVPNLVSPLTSVYFFQSSLLRALQDLEVEVSSITNPSEEEQQHQENDDLSVDELKIFADEELVDMAMKEAFKEKEDAEKNSTVAICPSNEEKGGDDRGVFGNKDASIQIPEKETNCSTENGCSGLKKRKSSYKRRKKGVDPTSEEMYAKVEEIAKIKKKQDEDKATVKLHSFNPGHGTIEVASPSAERTERLKPLRASTSGTKVKSCSSHEYVNVVHPEVALTVEVYHNVRRWVKTQEFLVLGRQRLTELRDKIYCITDQVMQKAGQHDPSGYFLIEDFFCNDLRDPTSIDYSEPIFDWLRNNDDEATKKWECINTGELQQKQRAVIGESVSKLPRFKAVEMQKTLFCDMKFRLGAGYLYCHQGDCKHTIVVRDMRLVHPEDVQNRAAYPIVVFQLKPRVQKCCVCRIYRATKVTVDDKWAQGNPCYFCDDCYYLLHYKDGSLVYSDFSVYDYLHD